MYLRRPPPHVPSQQTRSHDKDVGLERVSCWHTNRGYAQIHGVRPSSQVTAAERPRYVSALPGSRNWSPGSCSDQNDSSDVRFREEPDQEEDEEENDEGDREEGETPWPQEWAGTPSSIRVSGSSATGFDAMRADLTLWFPRAA